ncbi:putative UbiA prenyltransferase domain-containing protein 1-like protein [Hypsibius exemplaris]|uniref:UbiA prenyltransferase domain-containing protein 1-like protein n=1 Tax=Hypsibius exemplaris TaxID=2072580 RepID=A0A1W0X0W8_HYPEX|nr:putative UbiA prenyltransferase domain-containing protein 1-like protein [Hypsibius exemplaris]
MVLPEGLWSVDMVECPEGERTVQVVVGWSVHLVNSPSVWRPTTGPYEGSVRQTVDGCGERYVRPVDFCWMRVEDKTAQMLLGPRAECQIHARQAMAASTTVVTTTSSSPVKYASISSPFSPDIFPESSPDSPAEERPEGGLRVADGSVGPYFAGNNSTTPTRQKERNWLKTSLPVFALPHGIPLKLRNYLASVRPWLFATSIWPALLGCVLACTREGRLGISPGLLSILTVVTVHSAGNVVNTYFDYVKGFDRKTSDDRTVVDRLLSPDEVATLAVALYTLGCLGFLLLLLVSPAAPSHLALLFFGGISGSFLYTGGSGLKYIACGDLLVFVIFGPVSTLFSFLAVAGKFSAVPCWYSIPLAVNAVANMHCRDAVVVDDRVGGAVTLAMLLGRTRSFVLFVFLLYFPFLVTVVMASSRSRAFLLPLLSVWLARPLGAKMQAALTVPADRWRNSLADLPQQTAKANALFGVLYIISLRRRYPNLRENLIFFLSAAYCLQHSTTPFFSGNLIPAHVKGIFWGFLIDPNVIHRASPCLARVRNPQPKVVQKFHHHSIDWTDTPFLAETTSGIPEYFCARARSGWLRILPSTIAFLPQGAETTECNLERIDLSRQSQREASITIAQISLFSIHQKTSPVVVSLKLPTNPRHEFSRADEIEPVPSTKIDLPYNSGTWIFLIDTVDPVLSVSVPRPRPTDLSTKPLRRGISKQVFH